MVIRGGGKNAAPGCNAENRGKTVGIRIGCDKPIGCPNFKWCCTTDAVDIGADTNGLRIAIAEAAAAAADATGDEEPEDAMEWLWIDMWLDGEPKG